jgi:hypothetical protein
MTRCPLNPKLTLLVVFAATSQAPSSWAEDEAVYEKLANVQIGSIFFTPAERERLDERRKPGVAKRPRQGHVTPGRIAANDGAGYIIRSSGKEQLYVRGDFVVQDVQRSMVFPGAIKITKTKPVAPKAPADEDRETSSDKTNERD